ncbi:hypothetical protein ACP4OV_019916 [Aristida adscensionis]
MVGKGSPKFNFARGSPKLHRFVATTSAAKKKSPRCIGVKNSAGSPKGMICK